MTRNGKYLLGIIIISLVLFAFVVPTWVNKAIDIKDSVLPKSLASSIPHVPNVPFRLGLDLLGGAHLLYQADFSGLGSDVDKADAMQGVKDVVERRVNYFGVAEPVVQVSGTERLIVEIAGITDVNQAIQLIGETPLLEFKELSQGISVDQLTGDPSQWKSTGLSGKQLTHAALVFNSQTRQPEVSVDFNAEGKQLFAQITKRNIGRPIAIVLDGVIISAPNVQVEITDGSAVISGQFTPQEAKLLATRLNSGALPVPIKLISQQSIGASLGQESLTASLNAGMWGLLLVALFMIALYRLPGAISILALGVYTLAVLAIYKLLPVTLTLSGIAGFILSLGIGVDANVLIFARMREELAAGRPLLTAMTEGFRRSWPSIRDSHVTTFIGALVLYMFTTSIVKGFALTLGIGVILSLVTSTVVTRTFLLAVANTRLQKYSRLFS